MGAFLLCQCGIILDMIFAERKTDTGYNYVVDEVFGTISIDSTVKLDGDKLDALTMLLLHQGGSAKEITGTVEHDTGTVSYTFTKRSQWSEGDDMIELCNTDIPTKTEKQAKPSTAIPHCVTLIYSWCRRFVGAFLEAWRKSGSR